MKSDLPRACSALNACYLSLAMYLLILIFMQGLPRCYSSQSFRQRLVPMYSQ